MILMTLRTEPLRKGPQRYPMIVFSDCNWTHVNDFDCSFLRLGSESLANCNFLFIIYKDFISFLLAYFFRNYIWYFLNKLLVFKYDSHAYSLVKKVRAFTTSGYHKLSSFITSYSSVDTDYSYLVTTGLIFFVYVINGRGCYAKFCHPMLQNVQGSLYLALHLDTVLNRT